MNKVMRYMVVGLMAAGVAVTSYAGNITVAAAAAQNTYLGDSLGNYTPAGWLIEFGTFSVAPVDNVLPNLANFTPWVAGSGFTGGAGGDFNIGGTADDTTPQNVKNQQIYLVAFNNASGVGYTELGVYYVNKASKPAWAFPDSANFPNDTTAIDIQDLLATPDGVSTALGTGAHIVWGSSAVLGDTYNQIRLAVVPEPSTVILVGLGLLGLVGLRRRK